MRPASLPQEIIDHNGEYAGNNMVGLLPKVKPLPLQPSLNAQVTIRSQHRRERKTTLDGLIHFAPSSTQQ